MRSQTFRQCLLGLITASSCLSIILAVRFLSNVEQRKLFCMIISIQSACMLRCLWSAARKPLLKHVQRVRNEIIGLFVLLPFQLVLALVTSTSGLSRDVTKVAPVVLEISVLATCILSVGYTTCLLIIVIITSITRDADIWTRDIDSYPSPFRMPALFFSVFPCFSRPASPMLGYETRRSGGPLCLPGCQCDTKLEHPDLTEADVVPSSTRCLPGSLVQVPDAGERRAPIVIAFEVY